MEIDHPHRARRGRDGVAPLEGSRTDEAQIEQHLVELALRALEASDLGGGLEATRHPRGLGEHQGAQRLIRGRGLFADQLPGRPAQQGHRGGAFPARDLCQGAQDSLVLGQALAALGGGKLVGHREG